MRRDIWLSAQLSTLTWLSSLSLSICRGIRKKFPQNEICLTAFCPLKRWWWIPENIRSPRWEMSFSEEVSSGTFRQNRTARRKKHMGVFVCCCFFWVKKIYGRNRKCSRLCHKTLTRWLTLSVIGADRKIQCESSCLRKQGHVCFPFTEHR